MEVKNLKEPIYISDIVDVLTVFAQGVDSANIVIEAMEHWSRVSNRMETLDLELTGRGLQELWRMYEAFQRTEQ